MHALPLKTQSALPSRSGIERLQARQSEQLAPSDRVLTAGSDDKKSSNSFEDTFAKSAQQGPEVPTAELNQETAEAIDVSKWSDGEGPRASNSEPTDTDAFEQLKRQDGYAAAEPTLNSAATFVAQDSRNDRPAVKDTLRPNAAAQAVPNTSAWKSLQTHGIELNSQQITARSGAADTEFGRPIANLLGSTQVPQLKADGPADRVSDLAPQPTAHAGAKSAVDTAPALPKLATVSPHTKNVQGLAQAPDVSAHPVQPAAQEPPAISTTERSLPLEKRSGQNFVPTEAIHTPNKTSDLKRSAQVQGTGLFDTKAAKAEAGPPQGTAPNTKIMAHPASDTNTAQHQTAQTLASKVPMDRTFPTDTPRVNANDPATSQHATETIKIPGNQAPKTPVSSAPYVGLAPANSGMRALTGTTSKEALDVGETLFSTSRTEGAIAQATTAQALVRGELPPQTLRQISEILTQMPSRPVEITLSPEELGRLRMTVRVAEGTVAINMLAERPETLELLRRHIDHLSEEFQNLGFEDITFSFAGEGGSAPDSDTEDTVTLNLSDKDTADTIPDLQPNPKLQTPAQLSAGLDLRL